MYLSKFKLKLIIDFNLNYDYYLLEKLNKNRDAMFVLFFFFLNILNSVSCAPPRGKYLQLWALGSLTAMRRGSSSAVGSR